MKIYEKTWFIIVMLIVFFPVGLFLMWKYSNWNKVVKIIISVIFGLALIVNMFGGSSDDKKPVEDKQPAKQEQQVDQTEPEKEDTQDVEEKQEEEKEPVKQEEKKDEMDSWTMEQQNCYKSAKNYISFMPFSRNGLIKQLSSDAGDKYPQDVAEFAVSKLEERGEVDWDEQCEKAAKSYLDMMAFSKEELIQQLSSDAGDQYTREQAERAVNKVYQ